MQRIDNYNNTINHGHTHVIKIIMNESMHKHSPLLFRVVTISSYLICPDGLHSGIINPATSNMVRQVVFAFYKYFGYSLVVILQSITSINWIKGQMVYG